MSGKDPVNIYKKIKENDKPWLPFAMDSCIPV